MQRHCEPYFCSVERWRKYEDDLLVLNRLQLIETACKIFKDFGNKPETYHFDLVAENDEEALEIEYSPSAGINFIEGGDKQAFEAARKIVPSNVFVKAGLHFQNHLLKALAGWTEMILKDSNLQTRKTVIACVEKLFRLSEKAGKARFIYYVIGRNAADELGHSSASHSGPAYCEYPTEMLQTADKSARQFYDFLIVCRRDDLYRASGSSMEPQSDKETFDLKKCQSISFAEQNASKKS